MNQIFEDFIHTFLKDKVGLSPNFLTENLSNQLKNHLLELYNTNHLHQAGIGNSENLNQNARIRKDQIYWMDKSHKVECEINFLAVIDAFVLYLNATCYTGITNYEFHYAIYEEGSYYRAHVDQFKNNDSRKFSMIMYLNDHWIKEDGGELCIHHADSKQIIEPKIGTSVFFKSDELRHEVLLTNKLRMSITGWLKTN